MNIPNRFINCRSTDCNKFKNLQLKLERVHNKLCITFKTKTIHWKYIERPYRLLKHNKIGTI